MHVMCVHVYTCGCKCKCVIMCVLVWIHVHVCVALPIVVGAWLMVGTLWRVLLLSTIYVKRLTS